MGSAQHRKLLREERAPRTGLEVFKSCEWEVFGRLCGGVSADRLER